MESILGYLFSFLTIWPRMFTRLEEKDKGVAVFFALFSAVIPALIYGMVLVPTGAPLVYVLGLVCWLLNLYFYQKYNQPGTVNPVGNTIPAGAVTGVTFVFVIFLLSFLI